MTCNQIRERMPDVAAGLAACTSDETEHLASCASCAQELAEFRRTMALLDEWQTPEPSPYFDTRLQARLREEMAQPQAGWLAWFRRPVLASALTLCIGIGVGLFFAERDGVFTTHDDSVATVDVQAQPGTAVSDLQTLEKNHDMFSDFDLLDDLQVQQNVRANP